MKRCCFALVIMLYTIQLVGCDRQESTLTEDNAFEPTISSPMAEELDILEEDYPASSILVPEDGEPEYEYSKMTDIEVPYISELGYHQSVRIHAITPTDYVCWKDLLVIGNKVYRRKNEIYERTEERPQDWFDIDEDYGLDSYQLTQYENILIAQDVANSKIILYDLDTSRQISEYSLESFFWCVYKDKIYYRTWDEGIFRMDPLSGENELVYACDGGSDLMIRDNGDMLIMKGDRMVSDEMEFWLLSHDEQGDLSAKKIWETDEFEYMETAEFNDRGLFILGEYNYVLGGGFFCLKDNGEVETVVIEKGSAWARSIITEEGYFLWDSQLLTEGEKQEILFSWDRDPCEKATTLVDSISYYDYQGNKLDTLRLIDDEMLEAGYCLVHIVYGNGEIYAFYENEELDDLYISKVQPWEGAVVQE